MRVMLGKRNHRTIEDILGNVLKNSGEISYNSLTLFSLDLEFVIAYLSQRKAVPILDQV